MEGEQSGNSNSTDPKNRTLHKRKWSSYLLEFLMLFLAVFLGFVAENIREDLIDKETEQVYMQNMLYDLQADTAIYADYFSRTVEVHHLIDTIAILIKNPNRKEHISKLAFSARMLTAKARALSAVTRTYDEMKSSGHLRLVRNDAIAGKVSSYYNSLSAFEGYNDITLIWANNYAEAMAKLFDGAALLKIIKEKKEISLTPDAMISEDTIAMNELLTSAGYIYGAIALNNNLAVSRSKEALQLIQLIKEEYRLE